MLKNTCVLNDRKGFLSLGGGRRKERNRYRKEFRSLDDFKGVCGGGGIFRERLKAKKNVVCCKTLDWK